MDVMMPREVLNSGTIYAPEVLQNATETHRFFRMDSKGHEQLFIFPDDEKLVMDLLYHMDHEIYTDRPVVFQKNVIVRAYIDDDGPIIIERPFKEFQIF